MNSVPKTAFTHPIHFLAIGLGSGAASKAPGTWGSAVALIPFLFLAQLNPLEYAVVVSVAAIVGIYICGKTAADWKVHDHSGIVWDEFVGMWITLYAVPLTWYWLLLGFALFRLFDIWKPWPIRYFDRHVGGGLGIMIDDVIAGLLAWAVLTLTIYLAFTLSYSF